MILVAVDDLIFLSKIQETAQLLGVAVAPVDPTKLPQRLAQADVRAVILDLNHRSGTALEALRILRANSATKDLPILAFVSHVQSELIAAARACGCDEILARSAFSAQLPQLLKELDGQETPGGK